VVKRALLICCALAWGCGENVKPETLVEKMRVLSIVAEPPEIGPGESTELTELNLNPGGKTTVVWIGCQPDPFNLGRGACNDVTSALRPTSFADFPPGTSLLGFGPKAGYTVKSDLFDVLTPDDPTRQNGTVGQILAVTLGDEIKATTTPEEFLALFERIENREIQTLLSVTRVLATERAVKNTNPKLQSLSVNGEVLPVNATLIVKEGEKYELDPVVPDAARESYTLLTPDGPSDRTEKIIGAWYSTAGRFSEPRVDLFSGTRAVYTAPGSAEVPDDPVPERRTGKVWIVLRDGRGGQSWRELPLFVCDASFPTPSLSSIVAPASPGEPVVVRGTNLSSALDVVIGPVALANGSFSPARDAYLGDAPSLPAGTYPVQLRGKDCSVTETGLTYTVP
jgi:hypothetical protein